MLSAIAHEVWNLSFFDVVRKFKSILKFALHLGAIENEASVVWCDSGVTACTTETRGSR